MLGVALSRDFRASVVRHLAASPTAASSLASRAYRTAGTLRFGATTHRFRSARLRDYGPRRRVVSWPLSPLCSYREVLTLSGIGATNLPLIDTREAYEATSGKTKINISTGFAVGLHRFRVRWEVYCLKLLLLSFLNNFEHDSQTLQIIFILCTSYFMSR
ncbi:hypothetical protein M426DRAFT_250218 [Hypoxylon sp. CI-4A]|nr:hypothetical protein M426DRAFT_250218 [Hypoxylon sp. CI-4A]